MIKLLLMFLVTTACANIQSIKGKDEDKTQSTMAASSMSEEKYPVKVVEVFNGKVKYVQVPTSLNDGSYILKCNELLTSKPLKQKIPVEVRDGFAHVYYAESYFSIAKKHKCMLEDEHVLTVMVKQYPYKEERLKVAKSKVKLSKKDQKRVGREWLMTKKVYENSAKTLLIDKPFLKPLNSYITSRYGKKRIFNDMKRSQHLGNDFRAKVGVPIPVSNKGRVAFTGDLFYTGKVVIVDHGLNIFSLYAHLSDIKVKVGQMLERGQIVGLSGMTGRVSGPHLHWGIKMNGHNIDGFSLVEESQKQFVNESVTTH